MTTSVSYKNLPVRGVQSLSRPARLGLRLRQAMIAHAQRRQLAQLDDAALNDIGVSRAAAEAEAARPIWDVPTGWRR